MKDNYFSLVHKFIISFKYFYSSYEDDFEPDDDSPAPTPKSDDMDGGDRVIEQRANTAGGGMGKKGDSGAGDDIYDFTPSDLGY